MTSAQRLVIIGGGHASVQLISSLRAGGFEGSIDLFCAENSLPYQRPPLSKKFLLGQVSAHKLLIRQADYYQRQAVNVHLDCAIQALDPKAQQLTDARGCQHHFDRLVLATGGRARPWASELPAWRNLHALRSLADATHLREQLKPGDRALIIGAGYVGLETAASLRQMGCAVTVLEAQMRVLARSTAEPIAAHLAALHHQQGCELICGETASQWQGNEIFTGLVTSAGRQISADHLLLGLGMQPADELARAAGLRCDLGVLVDASGLSSHPLIYAIGDVARPASVPSWYPPRLESVDNAVVSAKRAAAALLQLPMEPAHPAWFWSDQYQAKLQMVGIAPPHAQWLSREDGDRLVCMALDQGRICAAQCINAAGDFMVAKRLVADAQHYSSADIANTRIALRDLEPIPMETSP